ncbi:hypothetical protein B0H13DRAFT_2551629 [Mycena leptocephala]|nr:hypothetical protein B0H13DRAFT_2551629 [Mycena leptocephala]
MWGGARAMDEGARWIIWMSRWRERKGGVVDGMDGVAERGHSSLPRVWGDVARRAGGGCAMRDRAGVREVGGESQPGYLECKGRDEKGVRGRTKASGGRTSRGCDEGWDGGAIVDEQATIRWLGFCALGIAGGLAGENARDDLGVLRESERRTLEVDIYCGTYGGGPHRCPRRMQSVLDGEGASDMEGAYGARRSLACMRPSLSSSSRAGHNPCMRVDGDYAVGEALSDGRVRVLAAEPRANVRTTKRGPRDGDEGKWEGRGDIHWARGTGEVQVSVVRDWYAPLIMAQGGG